MGLYRKAKTVEVSNTMSNSNTCVRHRQPLLDKVLDKPKFDKAAYQREYMRKRRAANRQGADSSPPTAEQLG